MKPNTKSPSVIQSALREMNAELAGKITEAKEFLEELDSTSPDSLVDEGGFDLGVGAPNGEGDVEDATALEGEMPSEEKEETKKIETPEEAKKVLDEAKEDLQAVVDALDNVMGEGVEEEKKASFRRFNDRYASSLQALRVKAEKAIDDANSAMKHWSVLLENRNEASKIKDSSLKQAISTIKDVGTFWDVLTKVVGRRVQATAVPPTGAEFSGDKWPNGKDPKMVEDRAWHKGADKFEADRSFEDARPNAAVDNRLTTVDYSRDDKPFVNASFKYNLASPYDSYWEITDTKTNRRVRASFIGAPDRLGTKDRDGLKRFGTEEYGQRIVSNAILQQMKKDAGKADISGLDFLISELNAKEVPMKTAGDVTAREPKVKDKASVRRYYAEAYGSPEYARELTSSEKKAGEGSPAKDPMNVEYTPKDDKVESTNTGEDEPGEAKDGPGTLSKQDPSVTKARVAKAIDVARIYASRGVIPFTKQALYDKAKELLAMSDADFNAKKATLEEFPIRNEAALKSAHIPDTETGIVGNPAEGVRDPKATVKTEGIDSSVKSDAKATQSAAVVPQLAKTASDESAPLPFNTLASKLGRKGIDVNSLNLRRPRYRS